MGVDAFEQAVARIEQFVQIVDFFVVVADLIVKYTAELHQSAWKGQSEGGRIRWVDQAHLE